MIENKEKDNHKKQNKKKIMLNVIIVILILTIIGCGVYLAQYYYKSYKSQKNIEGLAEEIDESDGLIDVDGVMVQKKYASLYKKNKDFIGWLTIPYTKIYYPVMQTFEDGEYEDGEYYIYKDFNKEYSASGLLFADSACSIELPTDNIIIYGHNMKTGTMFKDLFKYESEEFYKAHKNFTFNTIYEDGTYEVVAVFYSKIYPATDVGHFKYYQFVHAGHEEEFLEYVKGIQSLSIYDTGVNVEYGDKLVTLSTCAYNVKNGRFAVIGKRIK